MHTQCHFLFLFFVFFFFGVICFCGMFCFMAEGPFLCPVFMTLLPVGICWGCCVQLLRMLDVSHNPLGSRVADSVCSIVRGLPSLTSLSMSSCQLTVSLFQHNRPALAACFQGETGLCLHLAYVYTHACAHTYT